MKMLSSFASPVALFLMAGGLVLSISAQTTPGATPPTDPPLPPTSLQAQPSPPPSVDPSAEASDAGGEAPQDAARVVDDFAQTDTDGDGRVSAKEYAASPLAAVAMVAAGERNGTESPHGGFSFRRNENHPEDTKYFKRLDTDGDGYLSHGELEAGKMHR